jgi:CRP-like cAMP-binding protein
MQKDLNHFFSNPNSALWEGKIELKRGEQLLRHGEVENRMYYILQGAIKAQLHLPYSEVTIRLGYTGNIITALPSFINSKPSDISLEAIKKSIVLYASKQHFKQLIATSEVLLFQWIELMEQLILQQHEREIDLLHNKPEDRYNRVMARSNRVFQEIPAKYIADYLRMTPETLSRLKKS